MTHKIFLTTDFRDISLFGNLSGGSLRILWYLRLMSRGLGYRYGIKHKDLYTDLNMSEKGYWNSLNKLIQKRFIRFVEPDEVDRTRLKQYTDEHYWIEIVDFEKIENRFSNSRFDEMRSSFLPLRESIETKEFEFEVFNYNFGSDCTPVQSPIETTKQKERLYSTTVSHCTRVQSPYILSTEEITEKIKEKDLPAFSPLLNSLQWGKESGDLGVTKTSDFGCEDDKDLAKENTKDLAWEKEEETSPTPPYDIINDIDMQGSESQESGYHGMNEIEMAEELLGVRMINPRLSKARKTKIVYKSSRTDPKPHYRLANSEISIEHKYLPNVTHSQSSLGGISNGSSAMALNRCETDQCLKFETANPWVKNVPREETEVSKENEREEKRAKAMLSIVPACGSPEPDPMKKFLLQKLAKEKEDRAKFGREKIQTKKILQAKTLVEAGGEFSASKTPEILYAVILEEAEIRGKKISVMDKADKGMLKAFLLKSENNKVDAIEMIKKIIQIIEKKKGVISVGDVMAHWRWNEAFDEVVNKQSAAPKNSASGWEEYN